MVRVSLNGEPVDLPEPATVSRAVAHLEAARRIAVAVNGEVIPRGGWEGHTLAEGDTVEVVAAIQGGA